MERKAEWLAAIVSIPVLLSLAGSAGYGLAVLLVGETTPERSAVLVVLGILILWAVPVTITILRVLERIDLRQRPDTPPRRVPE